MNRMKALAAALQSAALSLWALPALVLAQAQPPGAQPTPAPSPGETAARTGVGWLWIIAAVVVLAIVWWALTGRRRREARPPS